MSIQRFEEIEGWQLAVAITSAVYDVATVGEFACDFGLKDQITRAAGSSMHNIAEGFDSGTNPEFVKFLRYAQRSCTEVKSQLYLALDRRYITQNQFDQIYQQADKLHAKIRGFIRYFLTSESPKKQGRPTT